jgi:hypothetical protein
VRYRRSKVFNGPDGSLRSSALPVCVRPRMPRWCGRRFCSWPMSTPTGATPPLPARWAAQIGPCANGVNGAGPGRPSRKPRDGARPAFSPSRVRLQVTALACTLPRDSGRPLSRWSAAELARTVIQRRIVRRISASTIKRWLKADRIKPWQYRSWQRPTDPRFLERAIPILKLYERAQRLARHGHIIVCALGSVPCGPSGSCGLRVLVASHD